MHCFFKNLSFLFIPVVISFSSTSSLANVNNRYGWRLVGEGKNGEWKLVAPPSLIVGGDYTATANDGVVLSSRRNLRTLKKKFHRPPPPNRNEASHGGGGDGNGGGGGGIG